VEKKLIKLAENTLKISKKKSWSSITFKEIMRISGINQSKIKNKNDILKNINRFFDFKLIKISKNIEKSSSKDMIFELMMMRFDILHSHRKSVLNFFDFFKKNPQEFVLLLPSFIESIVLLSSLGGIKRSGIKGNLQIKGLLVVYFSSFLTWRNDDSISLEKTMTALDNYLNRANKIINL
tara:strand:+ start:373 stop:912 length:540 start_codon:yes stop_codon:yes gene_type:complete